MPQDKRTPAQRTFDAAMETAFVAYTKALEDLAKRHPRDDPKHAAAHQAAVEKAEAVFEAAKRSARVAYDAARTFAP